MKFLNTLALLVRSRKYSSFQVQPIFFRQICVSHRQFSPLPSGWGSKKNKKPKTLQLFNIMADPKAEEILAPLRAAVKEQVNERIVADSISLPISFRFTFLWLTYQ